MRRPFTQIGTTPSLTRTRAGAPPLAGSLHIDYTPARSARAIFTGESGEGADAFEVVMTMNLSNLLDRVREPVLAEARVALECARLQHYSASEPEQNIERLRALFSVLEASARSRSVLPMVRHAENVARERHHTGVDLAEVLTAFNVLEEAIWRHVASEAPPAEYPDAFGLVSTILGAGKQALALQYVSLTRRSGTPALDVDALFAGV